MRYEDNRHFDFEPIPARISLPLIPPFVGKARRQSGLPSAWQSASLIVAEIFVEALSSAGEPIPQCVGLKNVWL